VPLAASRLRSPAPLDLSLLTRQSFLPLAPHLPKQNPQGEFDRAWAALHNPPGGHLLSMGSLFNDLLPKDLVLETVEVNYILNIYASIETLKSFFSRCLK
jgi:hypothetical protein